MKTGKIKLELERKYKKHNNYCNKVIKKVVQEKTGGNITSKSNSKEIWNSINDILSPESMIKKPLKIQTEDQLIEDPLLLAEKFNIFFKEKAENLAMCGNKKENKY